MKGDKKHIKHGKTPENPGEEVFEDAWKGKYDECLNDLKKERADFINYKNRALRDREDYIRYANQQIVGEFLQVKDNLERALTSSNGGQDVVEGVKLTLSQLQTLLKKHGVEEFDPKGNTFDPNYHDAVMVEEADVDCEVVGEVFEKGYTLNERVIRPAKVKIIKPKGGKKDGEDSRD